MYISELTLYTSQLQQQADFYSGVLGLPVVSISETWVKVKAGATLLTWHKANTARPYHFAFNIPANKINDALGWLKPRAQIIPFENKEIVDFKNWNALSVYFYDAAGNILELIARRELNNASTLPFGPSQLLNISEIGLAVENIATTYKTLNSLNPLPVYWGNFDVFCAAGNAEGLFIIVDSAHKQWFPTAKPAVSADLMVMGDYNFRFTNGQILPLPPKHL